MRMDIFQTAHLRITGMTCANCQDKIERTLCDTPGVQSATVSYAEATADVAFDAELLSRKDIVTIIDSLNYGVESETHNRNKKDKTPKTENRRRTVGIVFIIAALYLLLQQFGILNLLAPSRLAETNMSYGMLFVIGLITSVHCVAMCGGINLSQCIPQSEAQTGTRLAAFRPTFLYNLGRVVSYTAVGFLVGTLGSVITFSVVLQAALKLIAGIFMMIMGINLLGIFPQLRRFTPRMPRMFAQKINLQKQSSNSPLIVGLLNGLMPCGPLQAMQLYALSTGSPLKGAASMFLFSLGTVPLMFGLGALSSMLGKRFSHKAMTAGGILVIVLGLSMVSQGWNLSGITAGVPAAASASDTAPVMKDGVQQISSTLSPGSYPNITVQAGTPVKWTIDAPKGSVNGCNHKMLIPEYNIEYQFKTGENTVEFTPDKTGRYSYSCWMGMIRGTITVVNPGEKIPAENAAPAAPKPANFKIPSDPMVFAKRGDDDRQHVTIQLTDKGFSPAVIVVQAGVETELTIQNSTTTEDASLLLAPAYAFQLALIKGENIIGLYPTESFELSNGNNTAYAYIKAAEDIDLVRRDDIRKEVDAFEPLIYPPETFFPDTQTTGEAGNPADEAG